MDDLEDSDFQLPQGLELTREVREVCSSLIEFVEIDPNRACGRPVLRGTRFPIDQLIAEIAQTHGVREVAEDFDLDYQKVKRFLEVLSIWWSGGK